MHPRGLSPPLVNELQAGLLGDVEAVRVRPAEELQDATVEREELVRVDLYLEDVGERARGGGWAGRGHGAP
ncbi:hypothetical protein C8046_07485 [Serinibacter arcticus]|uniref:Uncharacterized protein n=1 Tax=Serinibacter arcticus TaxID=1655435 RepID=A0A2U1ZU55_9MICO|nr:hypothetical protein C8046_07485 [Serinibacter arcticus]